MALSPLLDQQVMQPLQCYMLPHLVGVAPGRLACSSKILRELVNTADPKIWRATAAAQLPQPVAPAGISSEYRNLLNRYSTAMLVLQKLSPVQGETSVTEIQHSLESLVGSKPKCPLYQLAHSSDGSALAVGICTAYNLAPQVFAGAVGADMVKVPLHGLELTNHPQHASQYGLGWLSSDAGPQLRVVHACEDIDKCSIVSTTFQIEGAIVSQTGSETFNLPGTFKTIERILLQPGCQHLYVAGLGELREGSPWQEVGSVLDLSTGVLSAPHTVSTIAGYGMEAWNVDGSFLAVISCGDDRDTETEPVLLHFGMTSKKVSTWASSSRTVDVQCPGNLVAEESIRAWRSVYCITDSQGTIVRELRTLYAFFSPDGQKVVVSQDGQAFDVQYVHSGRVICHWEIEEFQGPGPAQSIHKHAELLTWSPDSRLALVALLNTSEDEMRMRVYDCSTGQALSDLSRVGWPTSAFVYHAAWAPDMCSIVVLSREAIVTFQLG